MTILESGSSLGCDREILMKLDFILDIELISSNTFHAGET